MIPETDDDMVTDADLADAQKRWADPQHEPAAPELFLRPVYADGFRGDAPISAQEADEAK